MNHLNKSLYSFFLLSAAVLLLPIGRTQSQTKSIAPDPEHETVVLENDDVRVIRVTIPPHTKTAMHPHANRVVVPLNIQRSRATTSEGQVDERSRRPGQAFWANANSHTTENLSDDPIETIMVEIKGTDSNK